MKHKYWYLLAVILLLLPSNVNALTMANENFILQTDNLNMTSGKSGNEKLKTDSLNQNLNKINTDTVKYKIITVDTGKPAFPFVFSISETLIDFGKLSPTSLTTRTNTLTVSAGSSIGYSVVASENHPLTAKNPEIIIPNTTCDNGLCNEKIAAIWENSLTYGFGYRCDNLSEIACEESFLKVGFFRSFADESKSQTPQLVMSSMASTKKANAKVTYQVNVAGNQLPKWYSNLITFIATPNF